MFHTLSRFSRTKNKCLIPWKTASYSGPILFVHQKLTNWQFSITLQLLDFNVSSAQALYNPPHEVLCQHPYSWMKNPSSIYLAFFNFSAMRIIDRACLHFLKRSYGVWEDEAALLIMRVRLGGMDDPWLALSRAEEESKGKAISWAVAGSWCLWCSTSTG